MSQNLVQLISISAAVNALFYVTIFFRLKQNEKPGHATLLKLMLVIAFGQFTYLIWSAQSNLTYFTIERTGVLLMLLILPIYYRFMLKQTKHQLLWRWYWHLPFILLLCFESAFTVFQFVDIDLGFKATQFQVGFDFLSGGLAILLAVLICRKHKQLIGVLKANQEAVDEAVSNHIKWINNSYYAGLLIGLLLVLSLGAEMIGAFPKGNTGQLLWLFSAVFVYYLGYLGIRYLGIFNKPSLQRKKIDFQEKETQIITKKKKGNQNSSRFIEIDQFIRSEKLYLEPEISLNALANLFNISEGYMSQLVNNYTDTNFSTYINQLRVEEAKRLLSDEAFDHYTIVAIGLESGFNSKSTFYNAFKKHTGVSPTAYKKTA